MKSKKIMEYSIIGLGVFLITYLIVNAFSKKSKKANSILNQKKPFVCSHIAAIEGGSKAENNLNNIQKLLDNDIEMIEIDIQITKDNVPVLFHDNTLNAKTNGSGSISNLTWSQISGIRYKADPTQGIAKLEDAIKLLKRSGKPTIFQLDKCDKYEIAKISALGLFKGVEKQMLAKALSFKPAEQIVSAGILYMPMLPTSYVGRMTNEAVINEIANNCKGSDFLEAQFSDSDTLFLNGTLSKKLEQVGCKLFIVAVGGVETTNSPSYRGDNQKQWAKMISPTGAKGIMTNRPLGLKKYISSLGN